MRRLLVLLGCVLALGWTAPSAAGPTISDLIDRLQNGPDFRVRVQAALELGKSKLSAARPYLEASLDDDNAAVRAAAAAALKVLADRRALPALLEHQRDASAAVRAQVKSTITALRAAAEKEKKAKPEILVQLGKFRNGTEVKSHSVVRDVEQASRQKLDDLPGVDILETEGSGARQKVPVVMVTGRVKRLQKSREGSAVVYSASVELVMHKMPGQTLKGVVSGSAKAMGEAAELADPPAMAELMRQALEAALESAIRRAPEALRAAVE